jgi:hypothetical protein
VPKPASDLERYLAGEFVEGQDVLPLLVVAVAIFLLVVAPLLSLSH